MKKYWNSSIEELKEAFHVTTEGLNNDAVKQIRSDKGENVLAEAKKQSVLSVFLHQFCDLLVIILMIAAIISMISGNMESTIVILAVLVMNALLGTVQHVKAEKSLDAIKELSSPCAKVIRNGGKWKFHRKTSFRETLYY